jgi:hypothetical protein
VFIAGLGSELLRTSFVMVLITLALPGLPGCAAEPTKLDVPEDAKAGDLKAKLDSLPKKVSGESLQNEQFLAEVELIGRKRGQIVTLQDNDKLSAHARILVDGVSTLKGFTGWGTGTKLGATATVYELQSEPEPQSQAPKSELAQEPEKKNSLTLDAAITLQHELYQCYTTDEFGEKLYDLNAQHPRREFVKAQQQDFLMGLRELCLDVQKEVLPKYGFPGDQAGVRKMFSAMAPHLQDDRVQSMKEEINVILGLARPELVEGTWKGGLTMKLPPEEEAYM